MKLTRRSDAPPSLHTTASQSHRKRLESIKIIHVPCHHRLHLQRRPHKETSDPAPPRPPSGQAYSELYSARRHLRALPRQDSCEGGFYRRRPCRTLKEHVELCSARCHSRASSGQGPCERGREGGRVGGRQGAREGGQSDPQRRPLCQNSDFADPRCRRGSVSEK